jgi:YbbR domain-containing protein
MIGMVNWFSRNIRTFLLAFFLAGAVWVSAVTSADPDETRSYPMPVSIEIIGQDPGLLITNNFTSEVELVLRAPQSVWKQLTEDSKSVRAVVDISNLDAGLHHVPIQVQVSFQPVLVLSTSMSSLDLELEPLMTKTFPINVDLSGSPAVGYLSQAMQLSAQEVVVSGAESAVRKVNRVSAILDISGVRQNVETELNLIAFDENGIQLNGMNLTPYTIQVTIPVVQLGGYRDLAVKVVVSGRVADGYRLTSILVNPPVVTVFSTDIALIDSLPGYVETTHLDLSGVSADLETHLALNLPEGVSLVGDQNVLVIVGISPIEGSRTIPGRQVTLVGLSSGLVATISPLLVDLYLSGPLPTLESLKEIDIQITVDVTGLIPGTYQLTPMVTILLDGVHVETILPGTVEVIISRSTLLP